MEVVAQGSGNTLDMQVLDQPTAASESFVADNVAIVIVPASGNAIVALGARSGAGDSPPGPSGLDARAPGVEVPLAASVRVSPQPVSDRTSIEFDVPHPAAVDVRLYDANGREVRTLLHRAHAEAGHVSLLLERRGAFGERLAPGVYFLRIRSDAGVAIRSVVFLD